MVQQGREVSTTKGAGYQVKMSLIGPLMAISDRGFNPLLLHSKRNKTFWLELGFRAVIQGLTKIRSIYGQAGCTQVDLSSLSGFSWMNSFASNNNYCILMAGKAPCHQNTIAQREWFPPSTPNVWKGESDFFTFFCSTHCLSKKKKKKINVWPTLIFNVRYGLTDSLQVTCP